MFFGNKAKDEEIIALKKTIEELKAKNEQLHKEIYSVQDQCVKKIEAESKSLQNEVENYKNIALHSQDEGLIVFSKNGTLYFINDNAKKNLKEQEYNLVYKAALSGDNEIILTDCEASISTKKYADLTIVSLKRISIHDNKNGSLLERHNKNITHSLSDTQSVYMSLLEDLKEMMEQSQQTATGSTSGLDLTHNIVSDTTNLYKQIETEESIVNSLVQKSQNITEAITVIDQISFQTNILSLNAAVEAATAGEAGKGFAVVAGEVRNLATRSAEAAKTIKLLVTSIQEETIRMKESSDIVSQVVSETKKRVDVLITLMQQFNNNSSRSVFEVENISNKIFINLAKLDHVIYKNNLYQLIFGGNHNFNFVDHHNCRLGKWYDQGLGKEKFSHVKSYKGLEQFHKTVHDGANGLAHECSGQHIVCSKHVIEEKIDEIENGSKEVFAYLDKILEEKTFEIMKNAQRNLFEDKFHH